MHAHILKKDFSPLLKLAVPLALTGVVSGAAPFFETLFLAHLSQEALAAGALVSWLYATFVVIALGILGAINVLVSHKHGANDHNAISWVVRDGLLLGLLLVIPSFLLFWFIPPLFLLFGEDPSIVSLAVAYLHALAWGLLPNFMAIAALEALIGLGNTRIIMAFTVLSVAFVVFFSYVLIFGTFGFPALGIAGAGWGMTIGYWIIAILLALYILMDKHYKKYFRFVFSTRRPSFFWELLHLGVPIGIMYGFEVAFFFAITLIIGSLSNQALAANQIALQYMVAFMGVIFSIAQAITVRMGYLLGAQETHSAKQACFAGIWLSAVPMGIIAIVYWCLPALLISFDLNISAPQNISLIAEIKILFAISALFQIVEAIRIALFGALRALKDTHFTLFISVLSFWGIALPIGYVLATRFHLGAAGLWWGMTLGAAISVFLLAMRFKSKISSYSY